MKTLSMIFMILISLSAQAVTEVFINSGSRMVIKSGIITACYDQVVCRDFSVFTSVSCEENRPYQQFQQQQQGGSARYHSDPEYRRFVLLGDMEAFRAPMNSHMLKIYESVLLESDQGNLLVQCN